MKAEYQSIITRNKWQKIKQNIAQKLNIITVDLE